MSCIEKQIRGTLLSTHLEHCRSILTIRYLAADRSSPALAPCPETDLDTNPRLLLANFGLSRALLFENGVHAIAAVCKGSRTSPARWVC